MVKLATVDGTYMTVRVHYTKYPLTRANHETL